MVVKFFSVLVAFLLVLMLGGCQSVSYDRATVYYDRIKFPDQAAAAA